MSNAIMGINPKAQYSIAVNGTLRIINGNAQVVFGSEVEPGGLLDNRMNLVSYNNTLDALEYVNYFKMLVYSANKQLASKDYMEGSFVAMLDNGYFPFCMPPTFFPNTLYESLRETLKKANIQFVEMPAYRFDGSKVESESKDIWCSKMDAMEFLGISSLKNFSSTSFLMEVLKRCL